MHTIYVLIYCDNTPAELKEKELSDFKVFSYSAQGWGYKLRIPGKKEVKIPGKMLDEDPSVFKKLNP